MWDPAVSILLCLAAFVIVVLALKGDAVVWRTPPYNKFRELVRELEHATVDRVIGTKKPHELTLGKIGKRRIPEFFQTSAQIADGISIRECYGAIFIKDESITETISGVMFNAWILIFVSIGGMLFVLFQKPDIGFAIQDASIWKKLPILATAMYDDHFVLVAELVAILSQLTYLLHNTRLVRRLIRTFEKD